jgi:hypothetical protein
MSRHPHQRWTAALGAMVAALLSAAVVAQDQPPAARPTPAPTAQAQPLATPQITIADVIEDKQRLLRATVTLAGAPLQGAKVKFGVTRTFGVLDLGSDDTLDDGTAGVPFPEGLPGDAAGTFEAVVSVEAAHGYAATTVRTRLGGAGVVVPDPDPFPHALWSSKPLWPLVTVIAVLLTGVWSTYAFVIVQLVRIRREESPR